MKNDKQDIKTIFKPRRYNLITKQDFAEGSNVLKVGNEHLNWVLILSNISIHPIIKISVSASFFLAGLITKEYRRKAEICSVFDVSPPALKRETEKIINNLNFYESKILFGLIGTSDYNTYGLVTAEENIKTFLNKHMLLLREGNK